MAEASVALHPVETGPLASGATDANGRFQLETGNRPGVKPGEYRVTVVKKQTTGFLADKNGLPGGVAPGGIKEKWIVPQKYASPSASGLKIEVKVGMEPLNLDLRLP